MIRNVRRRRLLHVTAGDRRAHQGHHAVLQRDRISTNASLVPRQTFATTVRWVVGSPETVGGFSAACYYFVRELKKTVNVPAARVGGRT